MMAYGAGTLCFAKAASCGRLRFAAFYLAALTGFNLAWELAQLPVYRIWTDAPLSYSLFAAVHCTGGDLLIAAAALAVALILTGRRWPRESYWRVAFVAATPSTANGSTSRRGGPGPTLQRCHGCPGS